MVFFMKIVNKRGNSAKTKTLNKSMGIGGRIKSKAKNSIIYAMYIQLIGIMMCMLSPSVYAAPGSMQDVANGLINAILEITKYFGTALIVYGAVSAILAFKNDNAEAQTNGIRLALIGAALAFLQGILSTVGLI